MRPRGIPRGKHVVDQVISDWKQRGFNEAAGNTPRKTSSARYRQAASRRRFNEAAGNTPRKTYEVDAEPGRVMCASMRPRGIPRGKRPSAIGLPRWGTSVLQ